MRCIALLLLLFGGPIQAADPVRVAVAANFRSTLEQITDRFRQNTGYRVVLSSGSTGVLYNQIVHGAPFDLFFAADTASIARLEAVAPTGTTPGMPFCYARGNLVLAGGDGDLSGLRNPDLSVAIANPATAPYGVAAMAVLSRREFSAGRSRKLVRGTNVVQAYQFWHSGAVDLAVLPRALSPGGVPIPDVWHQPLAQHAIALTSPADNPALLAYMDWIRSDTVRSLVTEAGYEPCP